jgi:Tol biopolymer transport system component
MIERDGHCTYLPGNHWILCDSYPDNSRNQHLYLLSLATRQRHELGRFRLPPEYAGEWRCDLHPRSSPDGKFVTIDSPHEGGRQIYLLDISRIISK